MYSNASNTYYLCNLCSIVMLSRMLSRWQALCSIPIRKVLKALFKVRLIYSAVFPNFIVFSIAQVVTLSNSSYRWYFVNMKGFPFWLSITITTPSTAMPLISLPFGSRATNKVGVSCRISHCCFISWWLRTDWCSKLNLLKLSKKISIAVFIRVPSSDFIYCLLMLSKSRRL